MLYRILANIIEHFGVKEILYDIKPSYNIAPTHQIATVIRDKTVQLKGARWGMVAPFSDVSGGNKPLINARSETLLEKRTFRKPFEKRRCLIPADGYYEWRKEGMHKVPYYFQLKSRELFSFAGLYEPWQSPSGNTVMTCAIITTEANELVQGVHDRMPAILTRESELEWLEGGQSLQDLQELLHPYPAEEMETYEVSSAVNSFRNNSEECIKPVKRKTLLDYM